MDYERAGLIYGEKRSIEALGTNSMFGFEWQLPGSRHS